MKTLRILLVTMIASAWLAAGAFAAVDQGSVDKCKSCHEETVKSFMAGSHHGKAFSKLEGGKFSCESCHGSGDKHIGDNKKESIIVFGKKSANSAEDQAKMCLACHNKSKSLSEWNMGEHIKNDVACGSCHSIHKDKDLAKKPDTCFECHKSVRAQNAKMSHHPVLEGKVGCSDCHNPHGTLSHGMVKADNLNQLCYKCHADKRGPFIFEHAPVEENCATCHTPHGSNHANLLVKRSPQLCQDCHYLAHGSSPQDNAGRMEGTKNKLLVGRGCVNCHTRIHGTNAPAGTFFNR